MWLCSVQLEDRCVHVHTCFACQCSMQVQWRRAQVASAADGLGRSFGHTHLHLQVLAFPVHGLCGVWGMLIVGFLAREDVSGGACR